MRRLPMGWKIMALVVALAIPTLINVSTALGKTANTGQVAAGSDDALSKEDQAKLKEHNKLRAEITRVKYPASKSAIVSHVKGIKADDKKWFEATLPARTYGSADEVMSALGWETSPPTGTNGKNEKTAK